MKLQSFPRTGKFIRLLLVIVISAAFSATNYPDFTGTDAYSQVKKPKKRKNIFNLLFGKRGSLNSRKFKNRAKRIKLRNRNSRIRAAPVPAVVKVEKKEDAAKILVAGDFMAGGLAWGLTRAFSDNPDVVIVDVSKGLSGFVRDDVKDWPNAIAAHLDEIKPAALVFLGGMNDRQQMALETGRANKLSPPWLVAYNNRTKALANVVQGKNIPMIWVGLPPVKSRKMSADYLVFNEIYRIQVEATNGVYVDLWDGFTNAEGQYVSAGPDINGQIKRLRASDGINMNQTGKQKLAFYANRAIRKLTGIGTQTLLVSLPGVEDLRPVSPEYNPAISGKTIIYSLAGPTLDGGSALEGVNSALEEKNANKSVSYELVNSGQLSKTHPGRIDHYGVVANEVKTATKPDEVDTKSDQSITKTKAKLEAPKL